MFCARCGKELPADATFCPNCGAPVSGGVAATSAPVTGFDALTKDQRAQEYWVERFFAFVIDAIIVDVVLFVIVAIVALPFFFSGFAGLGVLFGGFAALSGLVLVFYFTVMESTSGASFGKKLFKLKVVSRTGSTPNFAEAFIRNLSKIYWLLLLLDVIIGLAISKGYQQKYSDHVMGTTVVKA
jgi:uncharacterized RDD family membrane protein YckC